MKASEWDDVVILLQKCSDLLDDCWGNHSVAAIEYTQEKLASLSAEALKKVSEAAEAASRRR
jgi:hypothetical protein